MMGTAWHRARKFVYDYLHDDNNETRLSKSINNVLITLIIFNVLAVLLESVNDIYKAYQTWFDVFEVLSITIFSAEYVLRFWCVVEAQPEQNPWKTRWKWMTSPGAIIDLLAILPAYINFYVHLDLRFLRILRLLRLLKLTRYFTSLQMLLRVIEREKGSFQAVLFILIILIVMAAAGVYIVENHAQPDVYSSIPASMWWAVVTLTTVGYGDVTPITPLGRALGAVITILGLGLAALPAGILATGIAHELEVRKKELSLKFQELLMHQKIDLQADKAQIEDIRKQVGLTPEQAQDIVQKLLQEQKELALAEQRHRFCFCPHCGKRLPEDTGE